MGLNLANEIKHFLHQYLENKHAYLRKLTFISHSLGGIIARESFKNLKEYSSQMHGYISLASPHLGYMYNTNRLIDAGMWFLKQWKNSISLQQLSMSDSNDQRKSYLY